MTAILDFTQNAMSKNTFWPHRYTPGIPENPLVGTQIMNHYILLKLYQFIAWPCTNGGHFISAYLQDSVSILTLFLLPGDWRPFWKIMLRQVCETIIGFWNLKSAYYYPQFKFICRSLCRFWIFYCFHLVVGGHFVNMQIRLRKWCITIILL